MNSVRSAAVAVLIAAMAGPVFAAEVPSGAINKTITISFNATGNAKGPDGRTKGFSTAVWRMIYISSAGRLFMRHIATGGAGRGARPSRGGDFDPDDTRSGKGTFQFQGSRLVGVIPYAAGARQITVTFDSNFSSCTASVIEGHAAEGVIRRKGPNGMMYEISSAGTSSPSCSVQSGNAFGGQ